MLYPPTLSGQDAKVLIGRCDRAKKAKNLRTNRRSADQSYHNAVADVVSNPEDYTTCKHCGVTRKKQIGRCPICRAGGAVAGTPAGVHYQKPRKNWVFYILNTLGWCVVSIVVLYLVAWIVSAFL